jgi:hypothetical protein
MIAIRALVKIRTGILRCHFKRQGFSKRSRPFKSDIAILKFHNKNTAFWAFAPPKNLERSAPGESVNLTGGINAEHRPTDGDSAMSPIIRALLRRPIIP